MDKRKPAIQLLLLALCLSGIDGAGCVRYKPRFDENAAYFQRMESQEIDGVKVSVVGLGAKETKKTFGVNLAGKQILPICIKIENKNPARAYFFLERAVDPDYYTAAEAAYMLQFHAGYRLQRILPPFLHFVTLPFSPFEDFFTGPANKKLKKTFQAHALEYGWVPPNGTRSGFVFVPFKAGAKQVTVDLYGENVGGGKEGVRNFEFTIPIPGIRQDYLARDFELYYLDSPGVFLETEEELKKALAQLPCCVTNKKASKNGDPINLIVIGTAEQVLTAFTAAQWDETEIIYWGSIWKMIKSFSFKKKYEYSPVSPLYLYGRSHDIAFQKSRSTINERMHLRLWYSPLHYKGKPVWVGTVSRDIGVRFTKKTWNLMTHKIDPDIDEAVLYTLSDLIYQNRVSAYGPASGVPPSSEAKPAENLTGDPYHTQGRRAVIVLSEKRHPHFPDRMFVN